MAKPVIRVPWKAWYLFVAALVLIPIAALYYAQYRIMDGLLTPKQQLQDLWLAALTVLPIAVLLFLILLVTHRRPRRRDSYRNKVR